MPEKPDPSITITLSHAQVDSIVSAAARGRAPSIATLIADSLGAPLQRRDGEAGAGGQTSGLLGRTRRTAGRGYLPSEHTDPRMSRALLRGLSLLSGFGPDGGPRGIVELAEELDMSPSTAHRYAFTLVELGLLERCPKTRKYRLPGS